mmetsp:Transcript_2018/g.4556  ORF Transcript_2018/g.4556 Transcript_2018/m.4556 type:complete len:106 (+) Transcript_2018:1421-1738(+)|eukprot:CAMPEP_0113633082 /NCGR_PEP_ID=MMETSP0017_2-20120614/17208_1 /TAXON_ID=2856 /ORGANISM="Cylindrotheca closterium" /LENGTH=105 /DNA_ID=CAMNT_0000543689 /DNA_START=53 /DNA_END=370 /DNA_ORIENTATION=+ /assembly_acc=CAM_ASM_000147
MVSLVQSRMMDDDSIDKQHTKGQTPCIKPIIKMSPAAPNTTFWRIAGMTYLQYVNRAAGSVRSAVKEPMKSKLAAQGQFSYQASAWTAGEQGAKAEITALGAAGK